MNAHYYVACDLGAESGRVILGTLEGKKLSLREFHRFPTGIHKKGNSLHWNIPAIFEEIKKGLVKIAQSKLPIESVSADSWGVDYVCLKADGSMLELPHHYRDPRTEPFFERCLKEDSNLIFSETGIQFMCINTLYQFLSDQSNASQGGSEVKTFLTIGDYINYLLSGVPKVEESLASTTQIYNPALRKWSDTLIQKYHFNPKQFPEIVPSGTRLGTLKNDLQKETGLSQISVVATCSHDTGAAVAAVPAQSKNWAFLSSGTWSLMGMELLKPLISDESRKANFTNEMGMDGRVRFLKNIVGLWILQECKRNWNESGNDVNYDRLMELAQAAPPLKSLIRPESKRFLQPGNMTEKVTSYCRETKQTVPQTPGEITRCILESLSMAYRFTLDELEGLTGQKVERLHIVGGGTQNQLLNQFAANATQKEVITGPIEATAAGNILIQAKTMGHLSSLDEIREITRHSFPIHTYHPEGSSLWNESYLRFKALPILNS